MSAKPGDAAFVAPADLTGKRREWHNGAVEKKAHRLLTTGRVQITHAEGFFVEATVRGDTRTYKVCYGQGAWGCDCPAAAEGQRCSHVAAVQLVTATASP